MKGMKNLPKFQKNNDYTAENVFDYLYHQKDCNLVGIDL